MTLQTITVQDLLCKNQFLGVYPFHYEGSSDVVRCCKISVSFLFFNLIMDGVNCRHAFNITSSDEKKEHRLDLIDFY